MLASQKLRRDLKTLTGIRCQVSKSYTNETSIESRMKLYGTIKRSGGAMLCQSRVNLDKHNIQIGRYIVVAHKVLNHHEWRKITGDPTSERQVCITWNAQYAPFSQFAAGLPQVKKLPSPTCGQNKSPYTKTDMCMDLLTEHGRAIPATHAHPVLLFSRICEELYILLRQLLNLEKYVQPTNSRAASKENRFSKGRLPYL